MRSNNNQKTHSSFPVKVRNGNSEIISCCEFLMEAHAKYRFAHGGSKELPYMAFHHALATGKFLKKAQIFLEHDFHSVRIFSHYEKRMFQASARLLKTKRIFTYRVRVGSVYIFRNCST